MQSSVLAPCLILSRNRPAQLDLLLQSIDRYARDVFATTTILYKYDNEDYRRGYNLTRERWPDLGHPSLGHPPARHWQHEFAFEADIRAWVAADEKSALCFLTDDAVFYRPARRPAPDELPFAYRTAGSYRWRDYPQGGSSEEGYPLTIVGTTYRTETILPHLMHEFPNPTALEAGMATGAYRFGPEIIHGDDDASLCMINANRVSVGSNMPHADIDPQGMNARYLAGERLDLDGIDFSGVETCQTFLPLVWRPA